MSTTAQQEPYVFLSYSRTEQAVAKRLEQDLQASGLRVWRDEWSISPGSPDWEEAIRGAISHAYAIVLVASPEVIGSLYIKGELNLAKRYHPRCIYPVWVSGAEWTDCVPIDFINTQYIDMRGEQYTVGLHALVSALRIAEEQSSLSQQSAVASQQGILSPSPLQLEPKISPNQQPHQGQTQYPQHQPHSQQPLIKEQTAPLQGSPEAPAPSTTISPTRAISTPTLPIKQSEKAAPLSQLSQPAAGTTLPHVSGAPFSPPIKPSREVPTKYEQQVTARRNQRVGPTQFPQVKRNATRRLVYAVFFLLVVLISGSVFFFAIKGNNAAPNSTAYTSTPINGRDVHMRQTNFDPPSVKISVDGSINLTNDSSVRHILNSGMWEGNIANPTIKAGAPEVHEQPLDPGQSMELGPFATADTFYYFCIDQPGMNLTIVVQ